VVQLWSRSFIDFLENLDHKIFEPHVTERVLVTHRLVSCQRKYITRGPKLTLHLITKHLGRYSWHHVGRHSPPFYPPINRRPTIKFYRKHHSRLSFNELKTGLLPAVTFTSLIKGTWRITFVGCSFYYNFLFKDSPQLWFLHLFPLIPPRVIFCCLYWGTGR